MTDSRDGVIDLAELDDGEALKETAPLTLILLPEFLGVPLAEDLRLLLNAFWLDEGSPSTSLDLSLNTTRGEASLDSSPMASPSTTSLFRLPPLPLGLAVFSGEAVGMQSKNSSGQLR